MELRKCEKDPNKRRRSEEHEETDIKQVSGERGGEVKDRLYRIFCSLFEDFKSLSSTTPS